MLWAARMPSQPFITCNRIRYGLLGSGCIDTKLGEFVRVVTCLLKEAANNTWESIKKEVNKPLPIHNLVSV